MSERLRELACERAFVLHKQAVLPINDGSGHQDDNKAIDYGFGSCPHPDCVLVRRVDHRGIRCPSAEGNPT